MAEKQQGQEVGIGIRPLVLAFLTSEAADFALSSDVCKANIASSRLYDMILFSETLDYSKTTHSFCAASALSSGAYQGSSWYKSHSFSTDCKLTGGRVHITVSFKITHLA